jgi:UDP-N-acetylglucosamine acyltransferase
MAAPDVTIHPTATVDPRAQLEGGVFVGPYCLVGPGAVLRRNVRLEGYVVVDGLTTIGEGSRFSHHVVIGTEPQDVAYAGEETRVEIGAGNVFREFVTVHRGTVKGGGLTRIGDRNYVMALAHIGHDCWLGNQVILTQGATLGGHCVVEDGANLSGFVGVHQYCRIGRYAMIGGFSVLTQDVAPFSKVVGARPPRYCGLNLIGLRRAGFSQERLKALKQIVKILFYSELNTGQALERLTAEFPSNEDCQELVRFIGASKRGIVKKVSGPCDLESD